MASAVSQKPLVLLQFDCIVCFKLVLSPTYGLSVSFCLVVFLCNLSLLQVCFLKFMVLCLAGVAVGLGASTICLEIPFVGYTVHPAKFPSLLQTASCIFQVPLLSLTLQSTPHYGQWHTWLGGGGGGGGELVLEVMFIL